MQALPICVTCGTQYPSARADCAVCDDPRQYVGWSGQQWTILEELARDHQNEIREEAPGLHSIHTSPNFAIGQRAFLLQTPEGNILWDCVALLDEPTRAAIDALGGIRAIAISHPHYYTTMYEWSRAFGNAPIYLHELDREWVLDDAGVRFWSGEQRVLFGDLRLVKTGGHFDGFQVLHWPAGDALFAGDQPQVAMDRRWVAFLWSYPNMVPLGARAVRAIVDALEPLQFDRLYGAFPGRTIESGAKAAIRRSAERHIAFIAE